MNSTLALLVVFLGCSLFGAGVYATFGAFGLAAVSALLSIVSRLPKVGARVRLVAPSFIFLLVFMAYSGGSLIYGLRSLTYCPIEQWYFDRNCWQWYVEVAAWIACGVFLMFAMQWKYKKINHYQYFIGTLYLLIIIYFIYTIAYELFFGKEDGTWRLSASLTDFSSPNSIMNFLAPISLAALVQVLQDNKNPLISYRYVVAMLGFFMIGLTYSYSGYLGVFLCSVTLLWFYRKGSTLLLVGVICVLVFAGFFLAEFLLSTDPGVKSGTGAVRVRIWREYLDLWLTKPLFGRGFGVDVSIVTQNARGDLLKYHYAHNVLLHILVQGGAIGGLLFLLAACEMLWRAVQLALTKTMYPISLISFMAPVLLLQKGPPFFVPGATWIVLWAPVFVTVALYADAISSEQRPVRFRFR